MPDNGKLVMDAINEIGIPLIMMIIRAHKNATGEVPTEAQVRAALNGDANSGIALGQAFLASKGAV